MKELIKIQNHNNQQLVDARELHLFLDVQTRFNDWIAGRIEKFGFTENQDYITFTENSVKPQGGRPSIDYGLTIDMAKELSMVENNDKGREARRYFIQKEKEALNLNPYGLTSPSRKQLAEMVLQAEEEIERKDKTIKALAPKAELMEKILDTDTMIDIGQTSKILGLSFGRNTLFQKLRERGIFFKNRNEPKQEYIERGYFQLKEKFIDRDNNQGFVVIKVLVTQRGLEFIANLFKVVHVQKELALIQ